MLRTKKAQSTLEYIIIFVAIVAAVFMLAYKTLKPGVQKVITASADQMGAAADKFTPEP
jgi:PDZ domain-containing secreted protein